MAEPHRPTAPSPEERAREVVLLYRTGDPDVRPPLATMIAQAIREAEQLLLEELLVDTAGTPEPVVERRRPVRA